MYRDFWITIRFQQRTYRFHVTYSLLNERLEQFVVKAKNKTITFQSNRPYLRSHPGLKKWGATYEVISGEIHNVYFKELIVQELERQINK